MLGHAGAFLSGEQFGAFQNQECRDMKAQLVKMEDAGTGSSMGFNSSTSILQGQARVTNLVLVVHVCFEIWYAQTGPWDLSESFWMPRDCKASGQHIAG